MDDIVTLNLLLLPILGGFIFVSRWNLSRFFILRADGYRILFHSCTAGICLLVLTRALILVLENSPPAIANFVEDCTAAWHRLAPFDYSGTAALSLLMGSILWFPMNWLILNKNFQVDNVLQRKGDPLELLLRMALGQGKPISLLLKNDEFYIGYVISNFNPIFEVDFLRILPILFGHRTPNGKIEFSRSDCEWYRNVRTVLLAENAIPASSIAGTNIQLDETVGTLNQGVAIPIGEIRLARILTTREFGLSTPKLIDMNNIKVIAHRGGTPNKRHENTIPAFRNVLNDGGDGFECDVALTVDGEPVITHKPYHGGRIVTPTGKRMRLSRATWKQVQAEGVPHLHEVLEFARDSSLECYLEPKSNSQDLISAIVDGIVEFRLLSTAHIITFFSRRQILIRAKRLNQSVKTSVILVSPFGDWTKLAKKANAEMVVPGWKVFNVFRLVDPKVIDLGAKIRQAHKDNLLVYGGIADDETTTRWLCELGVDGIYTNKVQFARSTVQQSLHHDGGIS